MNSEGRFERATGVRCAPLRVAGSRVRMHVLCLCVALVVALLGAVGDRPLESHEVFVAQTATEMLERGDWITPYFNEEPRLVKPPLAYWLVIGIHMVVPGGAVVSPLEARLLSVLALLVLVAMTVEIALLCFGRTVAVVAGLVCATGMGVFTQAVTARPDMLYGATCAIMVLGLLRAHAAADRSSAQRWWSLLAWVGFGLAGLAKGPHLPLMILAGAVAHLALTRQFRRSLWVLRPHLGVMVVLAIFLPWPIALLLGQPESLAVWREQLIANSSADRGEGVWAYISAYYLVAVFEHLLPWSVALPVGVLACWKRRAIAPSGAFALTICAVTIVLMSIPDHRREYYLLPVSALLSTLTALGVVEVATALRRLGGSGALGVIVGVAGVGAAGLSWGVAAASDWSMRPSLGAGVVTLIAACLLVLSVGRADRPRAVRRALVAATVCWGAALAAVGGERVLWSERRYELAQFAERVDAHVGEGEQVFVVGIEPAPFVYAEQSRVERLMDRGELSPLADAGEWLVAPTERIDELEALGFDLVELVHAPEADDRPGGLTLCRMAVVPGRPRDGKRG